MDLTINIPDNIVEILQTNPNIGRRKLSSVYGVPEHLSRFYIMAWNEKNNLGTPQEIGKSLILQDKYKKLLKYTKNIEKQLAKEEIFVEEIGHYLSAYPVKKLKLLTSTTRKKVIEEREAIAIWSDWHGAEVVNLKQMGGLNEYNFNIMLGRVWNLVNGVIKVVDTQRNSYDINILNLDILGDMISGEHHLELLDTNEFPILDVVTKLSHVLAQSIIMLADHFKLIRVYCSPGNHARLSPKPQFKNKVLNNYDTLLYYITKLHLNEYVNAGRVEFNIPSSPEFVVVRKGWAFLLGHSDCIRSYMNFPVYGFYRDTANQQKIRKAKSVLSGRQFDAADTLEGAVVNFRSAHSVSGFDYREAGHWHSFQILDDLGTIINSSLVGANEYSLHKLHAVSKPSQTLMFLSKRWGIKGIEPIYVADKGHKFVIEDFAD